MSPQQGPEPRALERGEAVGRFTLLGLLGRGGMGEVYAAYDPELDRKVAVKILRARTTEGEQRLLREAQAIAKLQHPNVVVVYDVGKFHDTVFIAMEFVDGNTLGYWVHAEPRGWRETLKLYEEAGKGLAAAHELGMIHRDFKPDNVMLTKDGQVRVMDFGLARQIDEEKGGGKAAERLMTQSQVSSAKAEALAAAGDPDLESTRLIKRPSSDSNELSSSSNVLGLKLTQTGAQVGTPAYMAPEQFAPGRTIDARTDQFSFCVALYEALYGERPFQGDTLTALTASVLLGEVRPAPDKTRVPGWLRRVLMRGLSVNPAQRFASMKALLAALGNDPATRWRRWATLGIVAAAAAGIALGVNRLSAGSRAMCEDGAPRFAGAWESDGKRRAAIQAAFARTGKAFAGQAFVAAARLLDDYGARWATMYRDACEATHVRGDQSSEVLDLRMTCLSDRLGNVRALTDVFTKADEGVVQNAVSAAGALPALDGCADVAVLRAVVKPPADPATRKRVDELREELARVTALRDSGQCAAAEKRGVPLITDVRATKYGPLLAEVLSIIGALGDLCGDPGVAVDRLKESFAAAVSGHHDLVAAEAAARIPVLAVNRLGQITMARDWSQIARASLNRLGGNARLEGFLLNAEAEVAGAEHDADKKVRFARMAQEVTAKALGPDHPFSITNLSNIGNALLGAGRFDEALAMDRVALGAAERVMGPEHPLVASIANNECEALNRLGRYSNALVACQRAIAIWQGAGTDPAIRSYGQTELGVAFLGGGHAVDAIAPLEAAVDARVNGHIATALQGESRFALARALWARPADRLRALALARQARADLATDPKATAAIDAWLEKPVAR